MNIALGTIRFGGLACDVPNVNAALATLSLGVLRFAGLDCTVVGPLTPALGRIEWNGLDYTVVATRRAGHLLRMTYGGDEVGGLAALGTVPGIAIDDVGGQCGIGVGRIDTFVDAAGVLRAAWKPPGAATYGPAVDVSEGGTHVLTGQALDAAGAAEPETDGLAVDKWVAVTVTPDRAAGTPRGALVRINDQLGNLLTPGDIDAAAAAAGDIASRTVTLENGTPLADLENLALWLDTTTRFCELSFDGATYAAPTSEADGGTALGLQTVPAGGMLSVHLRRTIPPATTASPLETVIVHAAFDDAAGGRAYATFRAQYRIANTPEYRVYWKADKRPIPGSDAVADSTATLPYSPSHTFAPGVWWIAVTWFDGLYESQPRYTRLELAGTALVDNPPSAPDAFWLEQAAGGQVYCAASYAPGRDEAAATIADAFALWFTTDGSVPGSGTADQTGSAAAIGVLATVRFDLGTVADGTVVKALVRMRRGAADSANTTEQTLVVGIGTATAPLYAKSTIAVDAIRP